ncbi:MAG: acyl-CoA thioesterase [Phycisphaerae bacterium]|nr:acyl-CoA thioesterase [Phycisphaerae bacterium]
MRSGGRNATDTLPAPTSAVPTSGAVRIRVRYCECDPMNVAHHAAYVPWLEMGRTELLRAAGVTYAQMEAAGVFLVITRLDCRYHAPARYDDLLEVRTTVVRATRVKIEHAYEVVRIDEATGAPGRVAVSASSTLACVDAHGKVRELPSWLAGSP